MWRDWRRLEAKNGEIGDYNQENSARWIFPTGIQKDRKGIHRFYSNLAVIELKYGSVEKARHILERDYLNSVVISGLLAILTIICGHGENGPRLEELIMRLKNYPIHKKTMGYLYYCYLLQGDVSSAENTLEELRSQNSKTILSEEFRNHVNTFITLCCLANEGKGNVKNW